MAQTVGTIYLAGLSVQGLGLLLHIVGLATPEWSVAEIPQRDYTAKWTANLWEGCQNDPYGRECFDLTQLKIMLVPDLNVDAYKAAEAFALIGLIVQIVALVLALLYVVYPAVGKTADVRHPLSSAGMCIFAFLCVLICAIIYGAAVHDKHYKNLHGLDVDIGYSFGLSLTGGILTAIGGVLVYLGRASTTSQ